MKTFLFKSEGNAYKANMHCHTDLSDGIFSPREIKELYKAKGYSVVAFTDHNTLTPHGYLNDDGFLAINACEVDLNLNDGTPWDRVPTYHFNLFATRPDMIHTPPPLEGDYHDITAINRYIANRTAEGFLVCYNHPYWSLQTYADYGRLKGCHAMEIYNHSCEMEGYYGYNPQAYDEMLRVGNPLLCIYADDNHNIGGSLEASFGGYIIINSESLRYESIMAAVAKGDYYSSQGPQIHEISLEGNRLTVKCSPCRVIAAYTRGRHCHHIHGEGLTHAVFTLNGNEGYIRIMCRDKDGKHANSNAYWL
jgi:hypothetical protein